MKKSIAAIMTVFALAACAPDQANTNQAENAPVAAQQVPHDAAAWTAENSQVIFLSSKINKQLNSITEQSSFTTSTARLDKEGNFTMNVDLSSVKTNIDIRDQRLKDWVFEIAQFPQAEISGKLDPNAVNMLEVGESLHLKQPLSLNIHGQKLDIEADLFVQRNSADSISVNTLAPVLLDVKKMDMVQGVAKLVEVMGLSSIVEQVPVSFSAEFKRSAE